ncbi:MAG TPA: hypothetical protein PKZ76_05860 [Xanthomonadaceae bacterium]|nr:hypothetical protein [Xanthomonadaceae bacterium]
MLLAATALPVAAEGGAGARIAQTTIAASDFGDGRLRGRDHSVELWSPTWRFANGELRVGIDYAYTRFEYSGLDSRNRDLHRLALPLSWTGDGAHIWHVGITPQVATSSNVFKDFFSRGSGRDIDLHGQVYLERPAIPGQPGWRLGLARDDVFGRPLVYPQVTRTFRGEAFQAELGWPRSRLDWHAGGALRLGAQVAPAGARWHVVSDERDGARFHYRQRAWRAGLDGEWRLRDWLSAGAVAGLEFGRRHRFEDDLGASIDRRAVSAPFLGFEMRSGAPAAPRR